MRVTYDWLAKGRLRLPLLVLALTAVAVLMSVAAASVSYWAIGAEAYMWQHHVALSAGIAGVVAPLFLYPLGWTVRRLARASEQLRTIAFADQLTGLPNIYALHEYLERKISGKTVRGFALHYVDIDALKSVNNTLGHDAGDALIQAVADRMATVAGDSCYLARIGGDEFALVQSHAQSESEASMLARRLIKDGSGSFDVIGHTVDVKLRVGISLWPLHAASSRDLLKAGHLAMHRASNADLQIGFFQEAIRDEADRQQRLERDLGRALRERELFLVYQPIFDMGAPGRVRAVEALTRWSRDDGQLVSPAEFVPVAERTGQIVELTEWLMKEACSEALYWPDEVAVSVNVSVSHFLKTSVPALVRRTLRETGLRAGRLTIEITESVLISDVSVIGPQLRELRELGVSLALDDFGAGFCGINYIRQFNVNKVKVDKSLLDEALKGTRARKILSGICRIAKDCHLAVTAEGVDNLDKLRMLQELSVDEVQGYLFSKPVVSGELLSLFERDEANVVPLNPRMQRSG
ncbi:MAG: bifunctional diguanylate cyclase/phosphodiesterase [Rhizobiaceae bacterium]|nr:bifunctional diguanylate cyclase/phosphodiesterase [Rhizobiaceae bacterium]